MEEQAFEQGETGPFAQMETAVDCSIADLVESIALANVTMASLHDRASASGSIDDRAELSVLDTTVRKLEELLQMAAEYDHILRRQLARTNARIGLSSG